MLKRRLEVLEVAETLLDVIGTPGRLHSLTGDRRHQFALDLRGPYRLVVTAATFPVPTSLDGSPDLGKVTAVRILEVIDYHG